MGTPNLGFAKIFEALPCGHANRSRAVEDLLKWLRTRIRAPIYESGNNQVYRLPPSVQEDAVSKVIEKLLDRSWDAPMEVASKGDAVCRRYVETMLVRAGLEILRKSGRTDELDPTLPASDQPPVEVEKVMEACLEIMERVFQNARSHRKRDVEHIETAWKEQRLLCFFWADMEAILVMRGIGPNSTEGERTKVRNVCFQQHSKLRLLLEEAVRRMAASGELSSYETFLANSTLETLMIRHDRRDRRKGAK